MDKSGTGIGCFPLTDDDQSPLMEWPHAVAWTPGWLGRRKRSEQGLKIRPVEVGDKQIRTPVPNMRSATPSVL